MGKIKGPAIFLAQFLRDEHPYNKLESICKWVSDLGYRGIQIPMAPHIFDLDKAFLNIDRSLEENKNNALLLQKAMELSKKHGLGARRNHYLDLSDALNVRGWQ